MISFKTLDTAIEIQMNIKQILEAHALWLSTYGKEGYRANLAYTNLTGANLTGANLAYANLEGAKLNDANLSSTNGNLNHIKSIFCDTYYVTYTAEVMQIGCQRHKFEDWWSFDDDRIILMDWKKALKWWRIWKPLLQQIIEASPAAATGYLNKTL